MWINVDFEKLAGETIVSYELEEDDHVLILKTESGREYKMYHEQDCCESVYLEDLGNLDGILGFPVVQAIETCNGGEEDYGTFTYTFYHIQTTRDTATLRWYGASNGYYSETVDFKVWQPGPRQ